MTQRVQYADVVKGKNRANGQQWKPKAVNQQKKIDDSGDQWKGLVHDVSEEDMA